jgi:hypothetical protein
MKKGNFLTNHLKAAKEGYFEHFLITFSVSCWIVAAGILHFIHSFFPFLFPHIAGKYIRKINLVMQRRLEICMKQFPNIKD